MAFVFTTHARGTLADNDPHLVKARLVRTEDRIAELRSRVDRLQSIVESMWLLLKENAGLEDAALTSMIKLVEAKGADHGKAAKRPTECARCGYAVSTRTNICPYCGTRSETKLPF